VDRGGQRAETCQPAGRLGWDASWSVETISSQIETLWRDDVRPYLLKYMARSGPILEAGCGPGRYVLYLSALGFNVIGLDFSARALAMCKQYALSREPSDIAGLLQGDVSALPIADGSCAGYISLGVVEHSPDPRRVMGEAYRVLRPGGFAVITTPNPYCWSRGLRKAHLALRRMANRRAPRPQFDACSLGELARHAAGLGFQLVEARHVSFTGACYDLTYLVCLRLPRLARLIEAVNRYAFPLLRVAERTPLSALSSTALLVARKPCSAGCEAQLRRAKEPGRARQCFLCGREATEEAGDSLVISLCADCRQSIPADLQRRYRRGSSTYPRYAITGYEARRQETSEQAPCRFCGRSFRPDRAFGHFGFAVWACPQCLQKPVVNLWLTHEALRYHWRTV
jgi:SAM-dependent methyltransferase